MWPLANKVVLRTPGEKKNVKDYRTVRKYDVLVIDGRERLIRPPAKTGGGPAAEPLSYVTNDELFDALHRAHGGRCRMVKRPRGSYCNVTKEAVMTYLKLCSRRAGKRPATRNKRSAAAATVVRAYGTGPPKSAVGFRTRTELIDVQAHELDGLPVRRESPGTARPVHTCRGRGRRPAGRLLESPYGRQYVEPVFEHVRSAWPGCTYAESRACRPAVAEHR